MPNVSPKVQDRSFTLRVDDAFIDEIDQLRALIRPVPSKSDAVRIAVKAELERRKKLRKDDVAALVITEKDGKQYHGPLPKIPK